MTQKTAFILKHVAFYILGSIVVAVLTVLACSVLLSCAKPEPLPPPNPDEARCLIRRFARQAECIDLYEAGADITACRNREKAANDCTDGGTD